MIYTFYHMSDNFGDKLTPYILSKIGVPFQYTDKGLDQEHYIFCGSILSACNSKSIIWGSGLAQDSPIEQPKEIICVRGRLTRDMVLNHGIECPKLYGDFGMLLPYVYKPNRPAVKQKIGILHHVAEYSARRDAGEKDLGWDLNSPVEATIDFIVSCDHIYTSSLHAMITAIAYMVPYTWMESPLVIGQQMKYHDIIDTPFDEVAFVNSFPFKDLLPKK